MSALASEAAGPDERRAAPARAIRRRARALALTALLAFAPLGAARAQDEVAAAAAETIARARALLTPADAALVERAAAFAREAHAGQLRDGGRPAALHAFRVADAVLGSSDARAGRVSGEVVAAALLHDVVEDTRFTHEDLRARFGERVAAHVRDLTLDPLERFGGDKAARDRAYYARFAEAPRGSHLVKTFDRLDNVRDMAGWELEGRLGYLQRTRETVVESLRARSPDLARAVEAEVERLVRRYEGELAAQARGLERFRRADGTLRWGELARSRAAAEGAGLLHFTLALFLKELAVVVRTGDAGRIDEFFEGLLSTDFFVHYGLFAAGARAGELAYARYLERVIRPRFVSSLLRTQVTLAAGLALPELARGTFSGEAFAISLGALGLSSTAVRAGLSGLRWVSELRAGGAGLSALGVRLGKLSGPAGWLYTVAETAVILYLADDIEQRVRAHLDARRAREEVATAAEALFGTLARARSEDEVDAALAAHGQAWTRYREHLYAPLLAEEARLFARLQELGREAKQIADERAALVTRVAAQPALRARLEARYGSVEAYAAARAAGAEAALEEETAAAVASYEERVRALMQAAYGAERRGRGYLAGLDADERRWLRAGRAPGAPGDPWGARDDALARLGRSVAARALRAGLRDVSRNRLETYADELELLTLASEALAGRPELAARVDAAAAIVSRAAELDQRLASSLGLIGRLERR